MSMRVAYVALLGACAFAAASATGQQPPAEAAQQIPAEGGRLFEKYCVSCHGSGGAGGRAPVLTDNRRVRGLSDPEVLRIIRDGTSNGMPGFASLPGVDLQAVAAYVRSLTGSVAAAFASADSTAGEEFFFGQGGCSGCHLALGRGSATGPDLSNIGQQMTTAELENALVDPSAAIAAGYAAVRVQLKDGRTLRGFARNEGNHVLPLQTLDGRLIVVDKGTAQITPEATSVMPPLVASPEQRRALIGYLSRLRGGPPRPLTTAEVSTTEFEEILNPRPGDWPTYHGRLNGNRYSALSQITPANVGRLAPQWVHSLRGFDNEVTPLVLDGIMYITAANQVSALDAATGREIWRYTRPRTAGQRGDAARGFNRGAAVLGQRVFLVTDNAHLIALSRVNGALLWEAVMPQNTEQPYGGTSAPLVVNDLVIAGVSGGDGGIRGFVAAYHAATGREVWRFWTVPRRGEPGSETWQGTADLEQGGGATWLTGAYDPETRTLFWPTGNPYPDTDGSERRGDNLYTNTMLALDARTGALRWYFQFTPHDLWDWDAQEPPVLVDAVFRGQPRKLLLQANRNGFFYVLDRTNGAFLMGTPFVQRLTWASGIGPDGRPQLLPGNVPDEAGVTTCPAIRGATNWMSTSFNPATRLFYVMAVENCGVYRSTMFGGGRGRAAGAGPGSGGPPAAGRGGGAPAGEPTLGPGRGGGGNAPSPFGLRGGGGFNAGGPGGGGSMVLRALDLDTGKVVWEVPQVGNSNNYIGTLVTAGGVLFYGQAMGEFTAADARTGRHLWHFETHESWKASPMTYTVNGRQHVAVTSGANVLAFALPQ